MFLLVYILHRVTSMGQSLLGALAAVVNYVYLRNPFADGIND